MTLSAQLWTGYLYQHLTMRDSEIHGSVSRKNARAVDREESCEMMADEAVSHIHP